MYSEAGVPIRVMAIHLVCRPHIPYNGRKNLGRHLLTAFCSLHPLSPYRLTPSRLTALHRIGRSTGRTPAHQPCGTGIGEIQQAAEAPAPWP